MSETYNDEDLAKNKVSLAEVDQIVASLRSVWVPMTKSDRGNQRVMVVGFTDTGRLLEVGAEIFPEDRIHYFHASDATTTYKRWYEKETRR